MSTVFLTQSIHRTLMGSLLIALATSTAYAAPIITNGTFETGDFTGWTTYITTNGTTGSPAVTSAAATQEGEPSYVASLRVGQVEYQFNGAPAGGGIYQNFTLDQAGSYAVFANIASQSGSTLYLNGDGGTLSLLIDGVSVSSYSFGDIAAGQTLRSTLSYNGELTVGTHELRIEATRPWLTSDETPFQLIDNVSVSAVPEAGTSTLMLLGCMGVVGLRLTRRTPPQKPV